MCPVMDYSNKTADTVHDVSAAATSAAAAVAMGRPGLVSRSKFVVVVTEASAANFDVANHSLKFHFEYSTDNATTWRRSGSVSGKCTNAGGVPKQIVEGSCAIDDVPEQNASADIQWRVVSDIGATLATTDDFQFQAYLGHGVGAAGQVD